ncbi:MAG: bifunctional helix-turn-helix transcriptional regulator/GNAT family N-acetyltransferase [Micromonosporaceae bacterium]
MSEDALATRVATIRRFNRFYTKLIGTLSERLLDSPYTLTEVRVLFELAQNDQTAVAELRRALGLDAGYLSRILTGFAADGLVTRGRSPYDARQQVLTLTAAGRSAFAALDARSSDQIRDLISGLSLYRQNRLVEAMTTIEGQLDTPPPQSAPPVVRQAGTGDYGWMVQRHGELYAREYGFDETFEALVARIVADFVTHRDPEREAAWIAEVAGERAGCVLCVRHDDHTAQLRVLLVEPSARGHGVGSRLVDECLTFAKAAGYERIVLSTNQALHAARRIYERAGFVQVPGQPGEDLDHKVVNQHWARPL